MSFGRSVSNTSRPSARSARGIIAQWGDGFQRHVFGALDGPLVVLLEWRQRDGRWPRRWGRLALVNASGFPHTEQVRRDCQSISRRDFGDYDGVADNVGAFKDRPRLL